MEETPYTYDGSESPATQGKMAPWLIVLLIVLGVCCLLILLPICVITILALLGPSIGNVFSDIVTAI